jgi:hypothetical protein
MPGKSLFLVYILVARLGDKQTVAVQLTSGAPYYALFVGDEVTFPAIDDMGPLYEHQPVWGLSDSNAHVTRPPPSFTGHAAPGTI